MPTKSLSVIYINIKRVFKTRYFSRWFRRIGLSDVALCHVVKEMEQGLIDANLGRGVVKKRLALPGRGKRGGARTLVATNKDDRWFFLFGFEKNERANITTEELEGLREITRQLLGMTSEQLDEAVRDGYLQEICNDQKS